MGPRGRSRHHRGRDRRPHARAHLLCHRVGVVAAVLPGRRHQRARPLPAQPRLAGHVRPRAGEGGGDAPARLRHGFGRQAPGLGLSLPVPRPRLHREGRQRLSAHPGGVEPGDLKVMVGGCMTEDERAFQAYSKIAEQITKEDGLVNQRLTWGASINGALLTLPGVGGGLFKDAVRDAPIGVTIFVCAIAIFLSIIAALVCGWTIKGIVDARKQISYIREIYDKNWRTKIANELGLPRPFGVRDDTRRVDPWWGDNLFRLMIGLWVIVIVVCVVVAAYRIASVSGHWPKERSCSWPS